LGGLPLALATAGALLRQTTISFAAYHQSYEQSWHKVRDMSPTILSYQDRTLRTTWDLSLKRVQMVNGVAADLVQLWAYFDHQDLWYGLIVAGQRAAPELCPVPVEDELDFHAVMKVLCDHSLAEPRPDLDGYGCHSCLHDWIRNVLRGHSSPERELFSLLSVGLSVPDKSVEKYWILQRRLMLHANLLYALM
jgi:hypothetical protein